MSGPTTGDTTDVVRGRWGWIQACKTPGYSLPVADATDGGWQKRGTDGRMSNLLP